ncbi:hypothetical protein PCE1_004955 [Barthelona sp. PCE]
MKIRVLFTLLLIQIVLVASFDEIDDLLIPTEELARFGFIKTVENTWREHYQMLKDAKEIGEFPASFDEIPQFKMEYKIYIQYIGFSGPYRDLIHKESIEEDVSALLSDKEVKLHLDDMRMFTSFEIFSHFAEPAEEETVLSGIREHFSTIEDDENGVKHLDYRYVEAVLNDHYADNMESQANESMIIYILNTQLLHEYDYVIDTSCYGQTFYSTDLRNPFIWIDTSVYKLEIHNTMQHHSSTIVSYLQPLISNFVFISELSEKPPRFDDTDGIGFSSLISSHISSVIHSLLLSDVPALDVVEHIQIGYSLYTDHDIDKDKHIDKMGHIMERLRNLLPWGRMSHIFKGVSDTNDLTLVGTVLKASQRARAEYFAAVDDGSFSVYYDIQSLKVGLERLYGAKRFNSHVCEQYRSTIDSNLIQDCSAFSTSNVILALFQTDKDDFVLFDDHLKTFTHSLSEDEFVKVILDLTYTDASFSSGCTCNGRHMKSEYLNDYEKSSLLAMMKSIFGIDEAKTYHASNSIFNYLATDTGITLFDRLTALRNVLMNEIHEIFEEIKGFYSVLESFKTNNSSQPLSFIPSNERKILVGHMQLLLWRIERSVSMLHPTRRVEHDVVYMEMHLFFAKLHAKKVDEVWKMYSSRAQVSTVCETSMSSKWVFIFWILIITTILVILVFILFTFFESKKLLHKKNK